jgi:hypothetical protein
MEARLAKVEAAVGTLKERSTRLEDAVAELRKELHSSTRWLVGLILAHMLANLSMLAALYAKVAGVF